MKLISFHGQIETVRLIVVNYYHGGHYPVQYDFKLPMFQVVHVLILRQGPYLSHFPY